MSFPITRIPSYLDCLTGEPNGTARARGEPHQGVAPPMDEEEINHNLYMAPLHNNQWQHQQPMQHHHHHHEPPQQQQQQAPNSTCTSERHSPTPSANAPPARGIFLTAVTEPQPQQLRRLEQHQQHLRQLQQRQELERQRQQRHNQEEEERQRAEQQRQLERQRRELLQLQLQQQQQEHRQRRQMLQWQLQLELEQQHQRQKQQQQQQQVHKGQSAVLLSPSSGLCTIYEAMETSEEDDEDEGDEEEGSFEAESRNPESASPKMRANPTDLPLRVANGNLRHPPQDLDWSRKVDMVQKLINQTLLLSGETYPPILLLPGQGGGTLSPLESSLWPNLVPPLSSPSAMVTSVSSYSPDSQGSSPQGDWTVVEVETHH